jgi:hypothetical protein
MKILALILLFTFIAANGSCERPPKPKVAATEHAHA